MTDKKDVSIKCILPHCETRVLVKAPPEGEAVGSPQHLASLPGIPLCEKHSDHLAFYIWAEMNIKLQPQQTKGGLVLPGHQQFDVTLQGHDTPESGGVV